MPKTLVDYGDCVKETLKALNEDRVLLVSQGKQGPPNAMAIGWGSVGLIWWRPVFTVLVRPSRYTYTLLEESGEFTVNVAPSRMKDVVNYCGTVSGRDHDKLAAQKLTVLPSSRVKVPILQDCVIHFECQVVHKSDLVPSQMAKPVLSEFYGSGDFHRVYFGEIVACQREE